MTVKTPILDFVRRYAKDDTLRLHMPGHKGVGALGIEGLDITEIEGADSLYEAEGIIRESEQNASDLFGAHTYYSTEGSSQCIRAMLLLAVKYAKEQGKKPTVAIGRNAHRSALTAAALLDIDPVWITPKTDNYLACPIDADVLREMFETAEQKPTAVYITSPDYLGNTLPLSELARVCHDNGALLLVDNAHGAYLKFLDPSRHPIDMGADMCCDSAHKTLPVLTGGAYLHLSKECDAAFGNQAKHALAIFGSTSPSYLILQSLDRANAYLETCGEKLAAFLRQVDVLKAALREHGYSLFGNEPLKLTLAAKPYGYSGTALAETLVRQGLIPEFADADYLVLMLTPELGGEGLKRLEAALLAIPSRAPLADDAPVFRAGKRVMSIREAMLSCAETVPVSESEGRVLAVPTVGCPPAVPIVVCGERIDLHAIRCFAYYGIRECCVVKGGRL